MASYSGAECIKKGTDGCGRVTWERGGGEFCKFYFTALLSLFLFADMKLFLDDKGLTLLVYELLYYTTPSGFPEKLSNRCHPPSERTFFCSLCFCLLFRRSFTTLPLQLPRIDFSRQIISAFFCRGILQKHLAKKG